MKNENTNKCFRCNKVGHWKSECYLNGTNRWFCDYCNRITNHRGDDCRYKNNYPPLNQNNKRSFERDSETHEPGAKMKRNSEDQGGRGRGSGQFRGRGQGRGRARGRGNFRGRNFRGSGHRPTARRADYEEEDYSSYYQEEEEDKYEQQPNENEGKKQLTNSENEVVFIADSGATEHIVNKSFILTDFKISENGVIKSANKNVFADIAIDGTGNLLLQNGTMKGNHIKLIKVIAAKNASENLLSLRKIADAGLGIYLDNEIFRVFNKENNKTIFKGIYEKPNWIVHFEIKKSENTSNEEVYDYEKYSCTACIAVNNELSEQSQTKIEDLLLLGPEGGKTSKEKSNSEVESAIGRENLDKLIDTNSSGVKSVENSENTKTDQNISLKTTNIIKLDKLESIQSIEKLITEKFTTYSNPEVKLSEAMLWHMRLGHASVNYMKMLQKKDERLKHIKFDESIKDCEVCILSKIENLNSNSIEEEQIRHFK